MIPETTSVAGDILTAIGLLTGKPEIEAAGAAFSAASGILEMAEEPSVQPSLNVKEQVNNTAGISHNDTNQWQALEKHLNGFQNTFSSSPEAQALNHSSNLEPGDYTLIDNGSDLFEPSLEHHQYIDTGSHHQSLF
jgi:hypothetical protein